MDSFVSPKDEIWFLRVYHPISNAVYTKYTGSTLTLLNDSYRHSGLKTDVSKSSHLKYVHHHYTRSHFISFFLGLASSTFWCRGLLLHLVTHTHTRTHRRDTPGREIVPSQRPLPEQHTSIQATAGFEPAIPASKKPRKIYNETG
jgi:hypothetical protein